MAAKIPIVFSQGTNIGPQQRDHEETLIAELLMEDRIEVSLITALDQLEDDDTDRLCLLGFQGDFVLMSSLDSSQVFVELERLGVEGQQGPTTFEPSGRLRPQQTRRTIYHVCVANRRRSEVRDEITRIREDAQIETVSISGIDSLTPDRQTDNSLDTVAKEQNEPITSPLSSEDDPNNNGQAVESTGLSQSIVPLGPSSAEDDDDAMDIELDSLVDELDELDL